MNDTQNNIPISVLSNQLKIDRPEAKAEDVSEANQETVATNPDSNQETVETNPETKQDTTTVETAPETNQDTTSDQKVVEPIISSLPFNSITIRKEYKGTKPVVLLILDGWGIGPDNAGNAIEKANTPNMDKYWVAFPHTQLTASGEAVGLPRGEDGNTETGHLNIGAGQIVYQDLPRINMSIANGSFYQNEAFLNAINHTKKNNSTLHLMGLIGAGGVHSNIEHLFALLNLCKQQGITNVLIHGFTDGRDSPPTSGINYVQQIMDNCKTLGVGKLATLMGRYYAMDRDKRWDRIEKAYDTLTIGEKEACTTDPIAAMRSQYDKNITDEFIEPINICDEDGSHRIIKDNDAAIFFNYRVDRPRELTRAFVMPDFETGIKHEAFDPYSEKYNKTNIQEEEIDIETFQRKIKIDNLYFTTMTKYEDGLSADIAFPPQNIKSTLCKILSDNGLKQLRATETEKERFVTYYMNGQDETMYPGEDRVIIPSKGVKSYDQAPEMSSYEIADEMIRRIKQKEYDFIIANICNGDMVGHTGNFEATVKACEIIDEVVGRIVSSAISQGGTVLITADHGNAEELINNDTGEIDTEHSAYPVPLMIIGKQYMNNATMLPTGILADIAPTILKIMGVPKPPSMTGRALI